MDTPDRPSRATRVRAALRRVVLGAFACTIAVIVLLVGEAALSAIGWTSDPHGYAMVGAVLFAAVLTPVAVALWLLSQSMRRRGN